jgi:hypothetical protein
MGSDPATEQADHAGGSAGKPGEPSPDPPAAVADADAKPDPRPWWRRPDCLGLLAVCLAIPLLFSVLIWTEAPPASLAALPRIAGIYTGITRANPNLIAIRVTVAGTAREFHDNVDPAYAIGVTRLTLNTPVTVAADGDNALWSLRDARGIEQLDTEALLASARTRWQWRMIAVPIGFTVVFVPLSFLLVAMARAQPRSARKKNPPPSRTPEDDARSTRDMQVLVGLISLLAMAGCVISLCNIPLWIRDRDLHQVDGTFARIDRLERVSKDNPDMGDTLTITITTASGALTCTQILSRDQVEPLRTLNAGTPVTASLDHDHGLWAVVSGPRTLLDAAPLIAARHAAIITQVIVTALVLVASLFGLRWSRQGERDRARVSALQKDAETTSRAKAAAEATLVPAPALPKHQVRFPVTMWFWGWENLICISQCIQGWMLIRLALPALRAADGDYGWNLATWRPLIALVIGACWAWGMLFIVVPTIGIATLRAAKVIAPMARRVEVLIVSRRKVALVILGMALQSGLLAWLALPALHHPASGTVDPGQAWCALIASACGIAGAFRGIHALRT